MNVHAIDDGDWKLLLENQSEGCVSIFMPTYRPRGDGRQDPVRLKNLLRDAEKTLMERGLAPELAAEVLAPAQALIEEEDFWKKQRKGLAVYCAPGFFRAYHLPLEVREQVRVSDRFVLRPLMPLYQTRGRFYVLALSVNAVRLIEGRREEVRRIDLEGIVPQSFDDALGYDQYDSVMQVHSTSSPGLGRQPGMVHGHGDNDQEKLKKDVLHYFKLVAKDLGKVVRDKGAPLVLAAVQEHFPLFREANRHPSLLAEGILGNPEGLTDRELCERAWTIVEPHFLAEAEKALARFVELRTSGKVSNKVEDVVRAADQGRVDVLLMAEKPELWGRYDETRARVVLHLEPEAGDEDLLERAAFDTLARGGAVFTVPAERLPDRAPAAAVYRY